jgi:putative isomerase
VDFLKEIYEPLKRENAWWFEHNDDDNDGIVQYTHPYSSGLDNSPLWDHGLPVESPDINTYLVIQMNSLARIAELIGRDDEAKEWQRKADELTERMIEHLWDEEAGIFNALHNEKPIPVLTPFNLYPMWTGQLPKESTTPARSLARPVQVLGQVRASDRRLQRPSLTARTKCGAVPFGRTSITFSSKR